MDGQPDEWMDGGREEGMEGWVDGLIVGRTDGGMGQMDGQNAHSHSPLDPSRIRGQKSCQIRIGPPLDKNQDGCRSRKFQHLPHCSCLAHLCGPIL